MQMDKNSNNLAPVLNIVGEKVALGPFQRDLLPLLYKWQNDFEVSLLSGDPLAPQSTEAIQADFERIVKGERHSNVDFVIYERATMRMIGTAGLRNINRIHGNAIYGIVIGEKDCWHKGYGTETTRLILDYSFTILNLHNVMLSTYGYNKAAQRAYEKAGFRIIGTRRQAWRWRGQRYDEVLMECLATEFQSPATPVIQLP